jgi:hypothetical protein
MIEVTVTSVLQLPAGKMIFCKWPEGIASGDAEPRRESRPGDRRDPRGGRDYRGEPRRETDRPAERPALVEAPRPVESAAAAPPEGVAPAPAGNGPGTRAE